MCFETISAQILPSFGGSRTGTTGMQFLKIGIDARSAGLSGNYIAVANDVASVYWNPSGMMKLDTQKIHFQFGQTSYFADIGISYGGLVYKTNGAAFGLSLVTLNSGEIPVTTEFQPFGTGETYSAVSSTIGLSFAKSLTNNFSFGITGKYARESIAGINVNNALFDFGFQYDIGLKNTKFAVSISNFGFNVTPEGKLKLLKLNGETDLNSFESVSVPAIFRIGFAWDAIKKEIHQLTFISQLNHPTDNNETLGLASEYIWKNIFFARMGYEFGIDEGGIPAFGIGIQAKRNFGIFRFDYGFNNKARLGSVHRFTLGVGLF